MAETTVAPQPKPATNTVCPQRPSGGAHCFHTQGQPFQNGPNTFVMWGCCCYCAPSYMRQTVMVPHNTPDDDVVAAEMLHGPLVRVERMQPPVAPPRLLVPNRAQQTKH